ncbi:MAG: hypothetical protein ACREJ3_05425 [Polyangiaceae bacterium]
MTALLDFDAAKGQAVLQKVAALVATTPEFVATLRKAATVTAADAVECRACARSGTPDPPSC